MPIGKNRASFALSLIFGVLSWELLARGLRIKTILLPAPSVIAEAFVSSWRHILRHSQSSITAIILGYAIGAVAAILLAIVCHLSARAKAALVPYLVISQVTPKAALAPLFIIWFGYGLRPRVIVAALMCFFPTFINTLQGLSMHDSELTLLMKSLRAGRLVTLFRLQLPFCVPYIIAGLKSSSLLSVVGCVVGEFAGADRGLGFLVLQSEAQLETPLLFAALFALAVVGALVYSLPCVLEATVFRRYMPARASSAMLLELERP